MWYFVCNNQRTGNCYLEFFKGKWDGISVWNDDSIFLDPTIMAEGFKNAIAEVIPTYNALGITTISPAVWEEIGKRVLQKDNESQDQYNEADVWAKRVFQSHDCFTIFFQCETQYFFFN